METHPDPVATPHAYDSIKRALDLLAALLLLAVLGIPMLLLAAAIRLDSRGPALFLQERLGRGGKVFRIWKFRTMVVGAQQQGTGIFTHKGDARITRVGRILRATSLDELPQIVNVLVGQMSLVGPRPPLPDWPHKYEDYAPDAAVRFSVRPGITGWSQVMSRNSAEWPVRLKEDAYYVANRSLALDIKICWLTIGRLARRDSVYRSTDT